MFSQNNYRREGHSHLSKQPFGQVYGSNFQHYRLVIVILSLLNFVLLVAAVVLGIYCSKAREGNVQLFQHSKGTASLIEVNYLRGNHSNVMKAVEEAEKALKKKRANHDQIKVKVEQQNLLNDAILSQMMRVRAEKSKLLSDKVRLGENCGRCLEGWLLLNSSCYLFTNVDSSLKKTWSESREDCISRGADLLVIESWEEQQLLNDVIPRRSVGVWWANGFWIGLTDIQTEGTWVWINNVTQSGPLYWRDGEPNNHGAEGENCGAFHSSSHPRKTLYDGKCNHHHFDWICEMKEKTLK